jgi:hypothetical protein
MKAERGFLAAISGVCIHPSSTAQQVSKRLSALFIQHSNNLQDSSLVPLQDILHSASSSCGLLQFMAENSTENTIL